MEMNDLQRVIDIEMGVKDNIIYKAGCKVNLNIDLLKKNNLIVHLPVDFNKINNEININTTLKNILNYKEEPKPYEEANIYKETKINNIELFNNEDNLLKYIQSLKETETDKSKPNFLYLVFSESLVVPAISVTIFCSLPISAFIKEDLPTFGLPITANLGIPKSSSGLSSTKCFTNSSNNSPVPLPLMEAIGK